MHYHRALEEGRMERFDDWMRFVFDHAVQEPAWYWSADSEIDAWSADPVQSVRWMTELFRTPAALAPYSRAQVGQGLWFLLGDGSPGDFGLLPYDASVALEDRLECIRQTVPFFASYVAIQCTRSKPAFRAKDADDLESVCFMWWDLWPDREPRKGSADRGAVESAVLDALTAIAALPSVACIESALHGLGHQHARHPGRTEEIVDALLKRANGLPTDLVRYAEAARRGAVQ
jgi:hypothetical protein